MGVPSAPHGSGGCGALRGLWDSQGMGKPPLAAPRAPQKCPPHPVARRQTDASGKESWVTNNTYWKLRLDPGFAHLDSAVLW